MTAVLRAALSGLRGRRLQALIIGVVMLSATATSTVALGLLANAHGAFDGAFAKQNGAHVTVTVNTSVADTSQLAATSRLSGVKAASGPLGEVQVNARVKVPGVPGSSTSPLRIVGRSTPDGPVDDLTLLDGHWPDGAGQIVVDRGNGVFTGSTLTIGSQKLTVVGTANSITHTAAGWVTPSQIASLRSAGGTGQAQMLYRFTHAGSKSEVAADIASVRSALPSGAVLGSASYLDVRQAEQGGIQPWVPFIIAFGVIALVISVLIVVNVVAGAVIAGTTRIGVLKAIGFSPVQVVVSYVLLVLVPALLGCAVGVVVGNLLAIPLLQVNAHVYQVGTLSVPLWVDVLVPLAAVALTAVGGVLPALRAGRMSAIQAITTGRAPRSVHGFFAHRAAARLRSLPRSVTLGLAAPAARPARTLTTWVVIVFGAAAVTFGIGLGATLNRVGDDSPYSRMPVQVSRGAGGEAPSLSGTQQRAVESVLKAQTGTRYYMTETDAQFSVSGAAQKASAVAYGDTPSLSGIPLISGRWYSTSSGAAEVAVNTLFLTDTGTSVGSTYTLISGRHQLKVQIVGEVFKTGSQPALYLSPATLSRIDSGAQPQYFDVALQPGTSVQAYTNKVSAALGHSYRATSSQASTTQFLAVLTLIAMLTILITVVAGLGVLNTVALQIRERAHDIGVYKAIGMTPRQTLLMVVCSVASVGLVAGIVGVPAGVFLHHAVVPVMAHAANSGYPQSLLTVYSAWELVLMGLAGLVIAIVGALGPAGWAAKAGTATALRAE
ncbi:FtsX-like permease family protein [Streptomyces sp. NPDC088350]|uniref:ABC transporter permease n=1 Tax=Streptomyces sp. NPDC088350 TaxID=3365854 RepID=UPI00381F7F62